MACLFVEILSPAKALSLAFQGEEIDTVKSISCIETAKNQLECLERKNFEVLPTVNCFLEKVKEVGGKYSYQNVDLPSVEEAKTCQRSQERAVGPSKRYHTVKVGG